MKLSALIELNQQAKASLEAFKTHYRSSGNLQHDLAVTNPLCQIIGFTQGWIEICASEVEVEVK